MRLLLPLLLLLAVPALAQSDAERTRLLAEQLLDAGADGAALGQLAASGAEQSLGSLPQLDDRRTAALSAAWREAFREEALREDVVAHFAQRHQTLQVAEGLAWLRRPEVARATREMREQSGPAFDAAFAEWVTSITAESLNRARLERIARISDRSGEARVGETVTTMLELGIRAGDRIAPRGGGRVSLDEALGRLRELGPTLGQQAVMQNQLYLYYVLLDLSVRDLDAYAEALNEPAGRWYIDAMHGALDHALDQAGQRFLAETSRRAAALN